VNRFPCCTSTARHWASTVGAAGVGALATIFLAAQPANAATPTYHVTTDVSARTTPTAAAGTGYGIPARAAFVATCQVVGQPIGPRGNTLYFFATYAGRQFYIPDTFTDSPHLAGQPPIAGISMCGAPVPVPAPPPVPAPLPLQPTCNPQQVSSACYNANLNGTPASSKPAGARSFKNSLIADEGLKAATSGYGDGTNRPGQWGGECRDWVNDVVLRVSGGVTNLGGERYDYNAGFRRVGAYQVPSANDAIPGDIVQQGTDENSPNLHTYIIVKNLGNGVLDVVDSNHMKDHLVRYYKRTYTTGTIWRLGQP
jgi:hypothetical protein